MKARLIAYYLPQFHPIPENDQWWGKGFTEWKNVAKAKPLYPGHRQPKLPSDFGFYDLRVPAIQEMQANYARSHGIEAFCYWHYWFGNSRTLLETVYLNMVKSKSPDFPFCLAWANESWSGIWHGSPDKVLMKQEYPGHEDAINHFYYLSEGFADPRYLKIDGKNLFLIYRPNNIPDLPVYLDLWRSLAAKEVLPDFYFVGLINCNHKNDYRQCLNYLDGFTIHAPAGLINYFSLPLVKQNYFLRAVNRLSNKKTCKIYNYPSLAERYGQYLLDSKEFPIVIPNWDNTPRSQYNGTVLEGSTPTLYSRWLTTAIGKVSARREEEKLVFIKSWNEWAEGNYLEPDHEFGSAYLQATIDAVKSQKSKEVLH